jgi:hypothetical protein
MESKTYSTIFVTSSILAFALIAGIIPSTFVNVLAQEGFTTESLVNETIALGNTSESFSVNNDTSVTPENTATPETIVTNATLAILAFAQEGAITPEGINNTMATENATEWTSNATLAYAQQGNDTNGMSMDNSTMMNATLAYAQQGEGNTTTTAGAGGGNATQGQADGNMTGLTQGQTGADGDNDEDEDDNGDDEEEGDKEDEE